MSYRRRLLPALLVLLGTGCITTAEQGRRMQQRIEVLERRQAEQVEAQAAAEARQKAALDEALGRIDAKLAEVTRAMDALGLSARKTDANFGATLDGMLTDIQKFRGELEELKYRTGQVEQGLTDTKSEVATRLENTLTEAQQQIEALKGDEAVAKLQAKQKAQRLAESGDRPKLLNMAEGRLKEGEYVLAREILQDYLKRWPDDPQAGGAQLLLAETYFRAKDYRGAIVAYGDLRKKYPDHPLMPGVLLNLGECFVALDLKQEAGQFYDAVIARYPKTDTAGKARKRKQELGIK
ncbi:MAG: tetratricopeptide repeat protein [Deltaproteobacteria bacterium]|nr:tetratricopeptide repeat protein [Deltaproteobacteria bacterium]